MRDGVITAAIGTTRSGKTHYVREAVRAGRYGCGLIWDVEGQYRDIAAATVTTRADLARAALAADRIVAYVPSALGEFEYWAWCGFVMVRAAHAAGRASVIVAEETADVTNPGKAPPRWGILLRRGLKYGADIFAITQRPSESDKTAIGNAGVIHCCTVQRAIDRRYIAQEMDIPVTEISGLDRSRKGWIRKNMITEQVERGDAGRVIVDGASAIHGGKSRRKAADNGR